MNEAEKMEYIENNSRINGGEGNDFEVRLAEYAGFCFGVKRAVDTVYEQLEQRADSGAPNIYTYGPIVHNEEVVRDLEEKGVIVIPDEESLAHMSIPEGSIVIIRAHGVPERIYNRLLQLGVKVVDATCPFVKKIHRIAQQEGENGNLLLIAGDPKHPEVEGIVGWAKGPVKVIQNPEEAQSLDLEMELAKMGAQNPCTEENTSLSIVLVAQTTYQMNKFHKIVDIFSKRGYNVTVVNTICNATEERQQSAERLAREADAMIVIGGRNSSNTRKLYEICAEHCPNTYYIQTLDDLHLELPKSVRLVGVTAGASTPQNIIEEVQNNVRGTYF